jgi:hypothetical protein
MQESKNIQYVSSWNLQELGSSTCLKVRTSGIKQIQHISSSNLQESNKSNKDYTQIYVGKPNYTHT